MAGCVVLVGRAKDTIVLSSGENVEPQPLEDFVGQSPLVKQVMIVGRGLHSSIFQLNLSAYVGQGVR